MSTSETTVSGKFDELAGKVKQAFGEATHNESVANEGAAQEVKGHGEQAWGSVKDAFDEKVDENKPAAEEHAHDLRESVVSAAANVKEKIQGVFGSHKDE